MLLAVNTTTDPGDKDDGKVNKGCLRYDLGKFPPKPGNHDGSWSKETCVLLRARMAAYTSDSPTVFSTTWFLLGLAAGVRSEERHVFGF